MSETPTSLKKLKVAELRDKCTELGIDSKGTKQTLLARIMDHLNLVDSSAEQKNGDSQSLHSSALAMSDKVDELHEPIDSSSVCHIPIEQTETVELDFVNDDIHEGNKKEFTLFDEDPKEEPLKAEVVSRVEKEEEEFKDTPKSKSPKEAQPQEKEEAKYMQYMHLDPYVSDLHFEFNDQNYISGSNISNNELHNFWCGVKATHGVSKGMVYFTCKYLTNHILPERTTHSMHGLRVGFSAFTDGLHLGDSPTSCGYDSSGSLYSDGKSVGTGKTLKSGDVVIAAVKILANSLEFSFYINNVEVGLSCCVDKSAPVLLFPHVYFKNCKFDVDFNTKSNALSEFIPIEQEVEALVAGPRPPITFDDCTVIVMVGLPASGKSTWASQFIKSANDRFDVLGRSTLYDRWRKLGQKRTILPERLVSPALNKSLNIAKSRKRNYILDQTHYLEASRKRRMAAFKEFGTRKAVVVLPRLSEHTTRMEAFKRCVNSAADSTIDEHELHADDVIDAKERITLPVLSEGFTEILYVDCDESSAPGVISDYRYDVELNKKLTSAKRVTDSQHFYRDRVLSPPPLRQEQRNRYDYKVDTKPQRRHDNMPPRVIFDHNRSPPRRMPMMNIRDRGIRRSRSPVDLRNDFRREPLSRHNIRRSIDHSYDRPVERPRRDSYRFDMERDRPKEYRGVETRTRDQGREPLRMANNTYRNEHRHRGETGRGNIYQESRDRERFQPRSAHSSVGVDSHRPPPWDLMRDDRRGPNKDFNSREQFDRNRRMYHGRVDSRPNFDNRQASNYNSRY